MNTFIRMTQEQTFCDYWPTHSLHKNTWACFWLADIMDHIMSTANKKYLKSDKSYCGFPLYLSHTHPKQYLYCAYFTVCVITPHSTPTHTYVMFTRLIGQRLNQYHHTVKTRGFWIIRLPVTVHSSKVHGAIRRFGRFLK